MIFDVISRILFFYMRSFSKIYFPDSLTVD